MSRPVPFLGLATSLALVVLALLPASHLASAEPSAAAAQAEPAPVTAQATAGEIDALVQQFNPDLYATTGGDAKRPANPIGNAFTSPASDIASEAAGVTQTNTGFMLLVYAPFLILPQLLLLYVVFKFRDRRGDPRKAATWSHNTLVEVVWTAIPCLALIAVGIPVYGLMWKMELPPKDIANALKIEVVGKSFAWDYLYKDEKAVDGKSPVGIGQDVAGLQEPVVLEAGRPVMFDITSKDVNHAWWIPAFGIKKDAIIGRYTNAWFTPTKPGFYKGQCAELCGQGHGIMIITAVVADHAAYSRWLELARHRDDTAKVWNAVGPAAATVDQAALDQVVATYLKDYSGTAGTTRADALRFWIASNAASAARLPKAQLGRTVSEWQALAAARRAQVEQALAAGH